MLWWFFFPLFSVHHMVRRRGLSTSLSLSPGRHGPLWRPTFWGRGFSAILFALFLDSPWDSAPLYLVMITDVLPVAVSFSSKLLFFHFMFLLSSWLIGEGEQLKLKGAVTHLGVSALETVLNEDTFTFSCSVS